MIYPFAAALRRTAFQPDGGNPAAVERAFLIIAGGFLKTAPRPDGLSVLFVGFFLPDGRMVLAPDRSEVDRRRRVGEFELLHRICHDLRHGEIAEPLLV